MRVLWFTDYPPPAVRHRLELADDPGPQAWVQALAERLAREPGIELAIATWDEKSLSPFEDTGVAYYTFQRSVPPSRTGRIMANWRHQLPVPPLDKAAGLVRRLSPDIVHVHGTEGPWGLLAPLIQPAPCVVSLQGILQAYLRHYFAGRSAADLALMATNRDFLVGRGPLHGYLALRRRTRREREILQTAHWFIGRTDWDKAVLASVNPAAEYFHCDEIMRAPFYRAPWKPQNRGANVYTTSSTLMGKGTECLLRAVGVLRRGGLAGIRLRVSGVPPSTQLEKVYRRVARRAGIGDAVDWLGRCDAGRLVDELLGADVFAYPSRVDNSPNSLVEAMLVGVPVVASRVGGVPTLLKDRVEGLLVPSGDVAALAGAIRRLIDDRELAVEFGANARLSALRRNDPVSVVARTIAIYEEVVARARSSGTNHGKRAS